MEFFGKQFYDKAFDMVPESGLPGEQAVQQNGNQITGIIVACSLQADWQK